MTESGVQGRTKKGEETSWHMGAAFRQSSLFPKPGIFIFWCEEHLNSISQFISSAKPVIWDQEKKELVKTKVSVPLIELESVKDDLGFSCLDLPSIHSESLI